MSEQVSAALAREVMADAPLSLASTDFALFGVPQRFSQDRAALDQRWKELQREVHPDRFAASDAAAQRQALQWSVRINEAYQRLKDPLRRATLLCDLAGVPIEAENNTTMPPAFLMQQMEWRESLEEAGSAAGVDSLLASVRAAQNEAAARCAELIDVQQDFALAAQQVRAWMFLVRFQHDVLAQLARLEDASAGGQ